MLWVKTFHMFGVICWFAGIFYLPRLFVYHAMTEDAPGIERFKVMERKLYRGIMTPSAVIAILFGVWLVVLTWDTYAQAVWLWLKIALVALMVWYHAHCGRIIQRFAADENTHDDRYFRIFNELPVLVLLAVLILVVVKPF